jgi:hypothetical protein
MYAITDIRIANDDGLISNLLERLSNRSFDKIAEIDSIITGLDYTFHFTLVEDNKICEVSDNKTCLATFRLVEENVYSYEKIEKFFIQCLASIFAKSDCDYFYEQITGSKSKELAKKYRDYFYQIVEKFGLEDYFINKDDLTPCFDEESGDYYYS